MWRAELVKVHSGQVKSGRVGSDLTEGSWSGTSGGHDGPVSETERQGSAERAADAADRRRGDEVEG